MDLVYSVMENDSYTNLSVEQAFSGKTLAGLDRSFATAVSYGTITHIVVIDAILSKYSTMPMDRIEPFVRTILRIGAWQIFWSDRIPDSAACNESVRLAKQYSNPGAASYVNGLLRTLIRERQPILDDFILVPKEFWLRCSLPRELAGYFKKWFGETRAITLCDAMNNPSASTARVNTLKTTDAEVRIALDACGCTTADSVFMDHAFSIRTNGALLETLPAFQNGEFVIQDEAAMLVSEIANPIPGQRVIDLCAAPGGKTCHMAERMKNTGEIIACDINPARLSLVRQNAEKLGITIIRCKPLDACTLGSDNAPDASPASASETEMEMEMETEMQFIPLTPADIVLADVPCSGLGILGKKPDIRIHMTHEKMNALYPMQRRILENAATLVKPGGFLIYSTCTINPAENQEQILQFLESHADCFETTDISELLPDKLLKLDPALLDKAKQGMVTLYPDLHHCDGFFMSKLRRKNK